MRLLSVGLLLLLPVASLAQPRPDFSGRWTLMPERSVFQTREGPGHFAALGTDFTIKAENDGTLTIRLANKSPWRVKLNGEATKHVTTGPGDLRIELMATAAWEEERVTIRLEGTETRDGQSFPVSRLYRLTANPDHTLSVESPDGDGGPWLMSTYRWLEAM